MTPKQLEQIGYQTRNLDWKNPKPISAEVVPVEGTKKKYAVLWRAAADGQTRAYGLVGGKILASPLMTLTKANAVRDHLLK